MRFQQRPVTYEAQQFTENDATVFWTEGTKFMGRFPVSGTSHDLSNANIWLDTGGVEKVHVNDWILIDSVGNVSSLRNEIFNAAYLRVE